MFRIMLLVAGLMCGAMSLEAQENALSRGPIDVTADRLDVDQNVRKATFSGSVVVKQGDMTLNADRVQTTYTERNEDGPQAIERVEATGKVTMLTPDTTATGDKAIYRLDTNQIEVTGNVVLTRAGNVLTGERLTYNMATGQISLQAKPRERVSARFATGGEADKDKQGD